MARVIIYNLVKLIGLFNIHEGVSSHTEKTACIIQSVFDFAAQMKNQNITFCILTFSEHDFSVKLDARGLDDPCWAG